MLSVVPAPAPPPVSSTLPGARVQRPLVIADEQHPRVVVEHRLRAVAVVGVVVEDHHSLALVGQRRGDDRDVGDHAEAHRLDRRWRGDRAGEQRRTRRRPGRRAAPRPPSDRRRRRGSRPRSCRGSRTCRGRGDRRRRRTSSPSARGTRPGALARDRPARQAAARAAEMASPRSARRTPSSTASSRSGRSGWRGPARCSRYAEWVANSTVTPLDATSLRPTRSYRFTREASDAATDQRAADPSRRWRGCSRPTLGIRSRMSLISCCTTRAGFPHRPTSSRGSASSGSPVTTRFAPVPSVRRRGHGSSVSGSNPSRAWCFSRTPPSAQSVPHRKRSGEPSACRRRRRATQAESTSLRSAPGGASTASASATSARPRLGTGHAPFESATRLVAYAISGRDGRNGYIQRLAVSPAHQHHGHGLALGRRLVAMDGTVARAASARQHPHRQRRRARAVPPPRLHRSAATDCTSTNGGSSDSTPWDCSSLFGLIGTSLVALQPPVRSQAAEDDLQLVSQNFNIAADGALTATIALPPELAGTDLSTALIVVTVDQRVDKREDLTTSSTASLDRDPTTRSRSRPAVASGQQPGQYTFSIPLEIAEVRPDALSIPRAGLYPVTIAVQRDGQDPVDRADLHQPTAGRRRGTSTPTRCRSAWPSAHTARSTSTARRRQPRRPRRSPR